MVATGSGNVSRMERAIVIVDIMAMIVIQAIVYTTVVVMVSVINCQLPVVVFVHAISAGRALIVAKSHAQLTVVARVAVYVMKQQRNASVVMDTLGIIAN